MVKISLEIQATMENIEELKPSNPDFRWYLKFTCSNCGQQSDKWNPVSLGEPIKAQRGDSVNHFVGKCKLCSRENSMSIIKDSVKSYVAKVKTDFQTITVFDCRGIEPTDFSAREGWIAKPINEGKEFVDVDLSEGEWADYCDKFRGPVGVYEIRHRFQRVK